MTITSKDIKIYQSEDNTDNDSGGGSRTAEEIKDGEVNNLFPDISRIDTVSGDVGLRKIHAAVTTSNRDVYYGAHMMIRSNPKDPKVSSLLFHTDDPHDKRIEAQNRIESYVTASYLEQFYLFGIHVAGSRTVIFLQTKETPMPEVGSVYLLKEGPVEQYIRVADIAYQDLDLLFANVNYERRRVTCTIEQPLEVDFTGSAFHPTGKIAGAADTFATSVSNAAKFYGTKSLAQDALVGDNTIKVDSIFEQLVPASKKQTPILGQDALVQGSFLKPTGNVKTVHPSFANTQPAGTPIVLTEAIVPRSITRIGGYTAIVDDGFGNLKENGILIATADYKNGTIFYQIGQVSGIVSITYEAAVVHKSKVQFTGSDKIDQSNQGLVFVKSLSPMPSSGDLYIDYRSQGKWYRIPANHDGTLGTDPTIGVGLINDNMDGTGSLNVTLGAIPDLDSSVIYSWGSSEVLKARNDNAANLSKFYLKANLGQTNIDPTSFIMDMFIPNYGTVQRITGNADGSLSVPGNSFKGYVDFINGELIINDITGNSFEGETSLKTVDIAFDYANVSAGVAGEIKSVVASRTPTAQQVGFTSEDANNGILNFSIGDTVEINSVRLELQVVESATWNTAKRIVLESDSTGNFRLVGRRPSDNESWGTVNASGDVALTFPQRNTKTLAPTGGNTFGSNARYQTGLNHVMLYQTDYQSRDEITVTYQKGVPASFPLNHTISKTLPNLFSFNIETAANISGEVEFEVIHQDGSMVVFSKNGVLYHSPDITGVGTQCGTFNYTEGSGELSYFTAARGLHLGIKKLFSDDIGNADLMANMSFKTASSKLTTSSFQLTYETANGTNQAQSDNNGMLWKFGAVGTTPPDDIDQANSYVDTSTGMASIMFASPVVPESVRYDGVAESTLPLDADLLGLNPVRLPSDGRVPVFESGRHLVIFHEKETAIAGGTPSANQVVNLGRVNQAYVEVVDANGYRLDSDNYVADRAAGTITFNSSISLVDKYGKALTAPFVAIDRIEDMLLVTDSQINGLLSLSGDLSHDFPKDDTKVASTLVFGDTGARVYQIFSQSIWDSNSPVWSDQVQGATPSAQYANQTHPIQIDNNSSVAGRWAIVFKSSTIVDVVEEKLGVVESNVSVTNQSGFIEPLNPATSQPYFKIPIAGLGGGWQSPNVLRFNTDSGSNNAWVIRTVQAGALSESKDGIQIEQRGDAN